MQIRCRARYLEPKCGRMQNRMQNRCRTIEPDIPITVTIMLSIMVSSIHCYFSLLLTTTSNAKFGSFGMGFLLIYIAILITFEILMYQVMFYQAHALIVFIVALDFIFRVRFYYDVRY